MKYFLIFLLLFFCLLLQITYLQVPLVLLALLALTVVFQQEWIFPIALICGVFVDQLAFRTVGISSLFFLAFLFLVFLYEQKFELRTLSFMFVMSFFGSGIYLLIFGSTNLLMQVFLSTMLGAVIFLFTNALGTPQTPIVSQE